MKRNTYKQTETVSLSLFCDQAEILRRMPNASQWMRGELTRIFSKPLSEYQELALKDILQKNEVTSAIVLSNIAESNGINVNIMQCEEFLKYHPSAQKPGDES